ncbi:MAG TPA: hypothetical protein VEA16_12075, partial [Vicinamibacterales bacterium]|nr:hypothetical protein [Vicinamibacterales bacterium]
MSDNRREFLAAAAAFVTASIGSRLEANGDEQAPAQAPASRAVATKDAPAVNLDGWQMTATEITIPP